MKNILLICALFISAGAKAQDSTKYYRHRCDSLQRVVKDIAKTDGLKKQAVIRHVRIVKKNPSQIVFLEGWVNRDLK